jgi:hypothetical protein
MGISGTLSLKRPPAEDPAPAQTRVSTGAGSPTRPGSPAAAVAFSPTVNARAIKATISLDTAEIAMLKVRDGQARTTLHIKVAGRNVAANISSKSLRKAIATITENGADKCVAVVQGKLERGDMVSEAGLVVQLKTPKARF